METMPVKGCRSVASALLLAILGCGHPAVSQRPDNVLPRDSFVVVLAEIQLVEAAGHQRVFRNDNESIKLSEAYNDVWHRTGISADRFESSYHWWWGQPEVMEGVLTEVVERLKVLEAASGAEALDRRRPKPKDRFFPGQKPKR